MSDLFMSMWVRVSSRLHREEGQALTEYALVLSILAGIAVAATFTGIGADLVSKITDQVKAIGL